jgi:hypothetical protein
MPNKAGHRRFGNVRRLPSGRYQARYLGPEGRIRSHPETFERKGDAERVLALVEAQMIQGGWADPQSTKIKFQDYAQAWVARRAGLRPRTADLYRWLLGKHLTPYFGNVPIGKITTQAVRQWRAELISAGVSATMAAKAYRLLRAVLATAVEDDKLLARNPCRIRGGGSEHAAERPVLTVGQVFELAHLVGRRPVGNVRKLPGGGYRLRYRSHGEMHTMPGAHATRTLAEEALWLMARAGEADSSQDERYRVACARGRFRQSPLGRGHRTTPERCRPEGWRGPRACRVRRTVHRRNRPRPSQITRRPPSCRHPGRDPAPAN